MTRLQSQLQIINQIQTQVLILPSTATAATRNVTNGSGTLHAIIVDNQKAASGNTKTWVKIYDITSTGWAPGTTLPVIIFPVVLYTSADDSQLKGTYQVVVIPGGLLFENGLSIAASTLDGDEVGADPGTDIAVELVTS